VAEPADSHEPQPNAPLESATKPSARSRPRHRVIKAVLASILIAGLLWWALPPVLDYVNRKPPVDNGPRALVVISIPPNTDVKKVLPRWTLDKGQESQLSIYFEASEGNQNAVRTPVTIVLISKNEAPDTLSCSSLGTTDTRQRAKIRDLDDGVQTAARADAQPKNLDATGSLTDNGTDPLTHEANVYDGEVRPGWDPNYTNFNDPEAVVKCKLPSELIWRKSQPWTTALVPQIDLVQSKRSSDENTLPLECDIELYRSQGLLVTEADPPLVSVGKWEHADINSYSGHGLVVSAQPTIILDERSTPQKDNITLAAAGIVFGLVGALAIYVLESIYDLTLGRLIGGPNV
jgi:hypothetical protein